MPLRIVFDARHVRDFGHGTYTRNLLAGLGQIDRDNSYFVTVHPSSITELAFLPPNFSVIPYARPDTELLDNVAYPLLVRRLRPSVCHIPLTNVPLFLPNPYVVTVHDLSGLYFEQTQGVSESLRVMRFQRGVARAKRIIAVSMATRRDVQSLLNIPEERTQVIYGAPDAVFLSEPPAGADAERQRVLERYRMSGPFLLYVGNVRPQKNIPRLIEAFAVLRGDLSHHPVYKDLELVVIGDEPSRQPAVRRAVAQTHLGSAVRFLGFVPLETLRIFYQAAAAFVFPSLYEGFGLPPLEAMASGTPVVTSASSSLPEVVGDAAILVNPENVFDIARGMQEVLLDSQLRCQLVQRGYRQARRFSWQTCAEQVLGVYESVATHRQ